MVHLYRNLLISVEENDHFYQKGIERWSRRRILFPESMRIMGE